MLIGRHSLAACLGALLAIAACDSSSSGNKPLDAAAVSQNWREVLTAITANEVPGAAFSFDFFGTSPGNSGVQVRYLMGTEGDTCSNYEMFDALGRNNPQDSWLLQVQTSGSVPGAYVVGVDLDRSGSGARPTATASLTRMNGGAETERHIALSGTITIHDGPTDETDWTTKPQLRLTVEADFPERAVQSKGCMGSGSVSGGVSEVLCYCQDGPNEFTCRPDAGREGCCHDQTSPRITLKRSLTASGCAVMCRANSLLFVKRCTDLNR